MPPPSPPVIHTALLDRLLWDDNPQSVQSLADALDLTPTQITHELEHLRRAGCILDAHPQLGYRLTATGLGAWVDHLQAVLGRDTAVVVYRTTASTQDAARRLIASRGLAADGGLVIADHQAAGRGRLGRRWVAPPGSGLMVTRACRRLGEEAGEELTGAGAGGDRWMLITAIAAARALDRFLKPLGRSVALKWPNDLMLGDAKLGGILVESFHDPRTGPWVVVGLGINTKPVADVRDRPVTSLAQGGVDTDRLAVLTELARQWAAAAAQGPTAELVEEWRARCRTLHQSLRVRCQGRTIEGTVIDLDPDAGLILRDHRAAIHHLPAAITTVLEPLHRVDHPDL